MAAADGEELEAEGTPGGGDGAVEFFVADAAKDLGLGGGTASADRGKGAALAEEEAEIEGGAGIALDYDVVVHMKLQTPKTG